jgi:hypothetical protein
VGGAGLLKLSSVYGAKKISAVEDLAEGSVGAEHNIFLVWKNLLGRSLCTVLTFRLYVQYLKNQIVSFAIFDLWGVGCKDNKEKS